MNLANFYTPLILILHLLQQVRILSEKNLQLSPQSCPKEIRDELSNPGKIEACLAKFPSLLLKEYCLVPLTV